MTQAELETLDLDGVIAEAAEWAARFKKSPEYTSEQVVDRLFSEMGIDTSIPDLRIIEEGYEPHPHQKTIHGRLIYYRFILLVCHRRFGKTVAAVETLHDAATRHPKMTHNPGRYAYLAPFLKQAKQIAWMYLKAAAARIPGTKKNESELYIEYPNGARITLYGGDNAEAMRGLYIHGIVIDEPADIKAHVWGQIIRPAGADVKGWALWIGTPKGINSFYERYEQALKDKNWLVLMFRADETHLPWLDDDELDLLRAELSDSEFRQEFLCDFSASAHNVVIPIDLVSEACARKLPAHESLVGLPRVLGVDVARYGGDRSVIIKRWGHVCFEPAVYSKLNNMELVGRVAECIVQWRPDAVFIDGGRGEGVIDRLRQLGHDVTEVQFGSSADDGSIYKNKRAEMWFRMKEWLKAGGVLPPECTRLKTELSAPTYKYNETNKKRLEPKEEVEERVGFSPDIADALACTFAYAVHVETPFDLKPFTGGATQNVVNRGGYNPYKAY